LALETVSTGRIFDPKFNERESTKSSVDDLILGRGDVSFRAAFTLRVTESQRVLVRKSRKQAQQYKRLYNVWSFLLSSLDVQDLGFLFSRLDDFCEEVNAVFIQENLEKVI
jgi:hypothetical protein